MGKILDKIKDSESYRKLMLYWNVGAQKGKEMKKKHKEKLRKKDD